MKGPRVLVVIGSGIVLFGVGSRAGAGSHNSDKAMVSAFWGAALILTGADHRGRRLVRRRRGRTMKDRTGIVILVLGIALILLGVGSCAGASRSQNDIGWSLGGMLLIVVGGLTAIIGLMVMGLSRR